MRLFDWCVVGENACGCHRRCGCSALQGLEASVGAVQAIMHRANYATIDPCFDRYERAAGRGGMCFAIEDENNLTVSLFLGRIRPHQGQPDRDNGTHESQMDCPTLRQKLWVARLSTDFHEIIGKRVRRSKQRRQFNQGCQSVEQVGGCPDRFELGIDAAWNDVAKLGHFLRRCLGVRRGRRAVESEQKVGCIEGRHFGRAATSLGGLNESCFAYLASDMVDAASRAAIRGGKGVNECGKAGHVSLTKIDKVLNSDRYTKIGPGVYGVVTEGASYD